MSDQTNTPQVPETQEVVTSTPSHVIVNPNDDKRARWFVVHTYSGHENKVAQTLQQRAQTTGQTDKIFEMLVPTQEKIQIKRGKKQPVREKIFPGYMLVKMILTDETWLLVRTTSGVTGFVGNGSKPTPLASHEVQTIQKYMSQGAPSYKAGFSEGEAVKIVEGPFADFIGTVSGIDEGKGKVTVLVSIFGRETPVELDFLQVAKI
ncbi:transcription termination/antitermination protein NusG [Candidatus Cerribacteria bacterium 'Amazon FNV 2010 28 9']|uniref:Transcription termination/antitermination protein NusG n=1 Tax=Candidatus Cerribacteria bacterium 'Amazon FNV 2010 28 9' TaxID=2081795 RepID=A0A317JQ48_9BACT|nr:MAG: transcription termination/antitermination protein NusG [Candidatus Cerribacteria bacterium 'Amazon FNV 2010 28 9']